ncbi:hypothetical protein W97_01191 [Coniosporium apollinis CBS 100218]|uniref:Uncharacterized protein n=1 Tax=Coniosporium apollinis (strain CBS 100218) TaxID=1168221 RepID=R7YJB8_CONA1|nr:uncharacterized protein W97_01191 [Coniosporium apollinis CBS 100218]EON61973.1 hypothetical protein W97_01191 [Coniosporium apollinis CBS 100218]
MTQPNIHWVYYPVPGPFGSGYPGIPPPPVPVPVNSPHSPSPQPPPAPAPTQPTYDDEPYEIIHIKRRYSTPPTAHHHEPPPPPSPPPPAPPAPPAPAPRAHSPPRPRRRTSIVFHDSSTEDDRRATPAPRRPEIHYRHVSAPEQKRDDRHGHDVHRGVEYRDVSHHGPSRYEHYVAVDDYDGYHHPSPPPPQRRPPPAQPPPARHPHHDHSPPPPRRLATREAMIPGPPPRPPPARHHYHEPELSRGRNRSPLRSAMRAPSRPRPGRHSAGFDRPARSTDSLAVNFNEARVSFAPEPRSSRRHDSFSDSDIEIEQVRTRRRYRPGYDGHDSIEHEAPPDDFSNFDDHRGYHYEYHRVVARDAEPLPAPTPPPTTKKQDNHQPSGPKHPAPASAPTSAPTSTPALAPAKPEPCSHCNPPKEAASKPDSTKVAPAPKEKAPEQHWEEDWDSDTATHDSREPFTHVDVREVRRSDGRCIEIEETTHLPEEHHRDGGRSVRMSWRDV